MSHLLRSQPTAVAIVPAAASQVEVCQPRLEQVLHLCSTTHSMLQLKRCLSARQPCSTAVRSSEVADSAALAPLEGFTFDG